MISIILLPIFCLCFFIKRDALKKYGAINIAIWDGKELDIGTIGIQKYLDTKKYYIFNLTGDSNTDRIKFNESEKIIRKIIKTKDSINGVKFHFEKKSQYWSFIRAVEILKAENAEFFVPYKNDIWFTNPKIKHDEKKIKTWVCGNVSNKKQINVNENNSKIEFEKIAENIKKYIVPIILYLGMVYFTFRKNKIGNKGIR